jgi:hypothetical protein
LAFAATPRPHARYKRGAFTQFDATNANLTWASEINSAGEMVGWYNPGTSTLPLGFKGRF